MSNTPTDNAWLDELVDKYRADIMLAAQGMKSDNETYRESATNVAALSSINIKDEIRRHIDTVCREAYRKGYNDNARDCFCGSPGATEGVIPHHHLLDDGESHNVRPDLTQLNPNKDTEATKEVK